MKAKDLFLLLTILFGAVGAYYFISPMFGAVENYTTFGAYFHVAAAFFGYLWLGAEAICALRRRNFGY